MLDLVGNPEDRFAHVAAHIVISLYSEICPVMKIQQFYNNNCIICVLSHKHQSLFKLFDPYVLDKAKYTMDYQKT